MQAASALASGADPHGPDDLGEVGLVVEIRIVAAGQSDGHRKPRGEDQVAPAPHADLHDLVLGLGEEREVALDQIGAIAGDDGLVGRHLKREIGALIAQDSQLPLKDFGGLRIVRGRRRPRRDLQRGISMPVAVVVRLRTAERLVSECKHVFPPGHALQLFHRRPRRRQELPVVGDLDGELEIAVSEGGHENESIAGAARAQVHRTA